MLNQDKLSHISRCAGTLFYHVYGKHAISDKVAAHVPPSHTGLRHASLVCWTGFRPSYSPSPGTPCVHSKQEFQDYSPPAHLPPLPPVACDGKQNRKTEQGAVERQHITADSSCLLPVCLHGPCAFVSNSRTFLLPVQLCCALPW